MSVAQATVLPEDGTLDLPNRSVFEQYAARADFPGAMQVREVKRPVVPELDDEFAKDLGDFDDLAGLQVKVLEDLEARKKHEAEMGARQAVLDKVLLENPVVLPDSLVENETRRRLEDFVRNLMTQGVDPDKAKVDWEALRKQQEEPSRKAVHARLLLDALAVVETIEVDDKLSSMIHDGVSQTKLEQYCRTQSHSLRQDGIRKVIQGETSLDEVLRVTRDGG